MNNILTPTVTAAALQTGAAIVVRPDAGVLALGDADRVDFLQRMTTADIKRTGAGRAAVTVLTSPTAKIVFVFTVLNSGDPLLLLPAPGESAALERHLRGQIFFMDKVTVRNRSAELTRFRVVGPRAAGALAAAGLSVPAADGDWSAVEGGYLLRQEQYELPGFEAIAPAALAATWQQQLQAAGATIVDDAALLEAERIALGRPAAGAELTGEFNPLEAGMGWACAENKGCYTGQEIIARQVTYDKVTRTLVHLHSAAPLRRSAPVLVDGREVGMVTSSALLPGGEPLALAILKRPFNQAGVSVEVDSVAAVVQPIAGK
jgi:folate-binding protein YgfZ